MTNYEHNHRANLKTNVETARLIDDGKSNSEIEVALAVNELTRRVSQHQSITLKQAKKLITNLIEVN